ncbi:hypothetical protein FVEN_g10301 [Fusarium venenatum]|uniref:Uncharacterized protein n=1 Tax=Fusarium venenatum TaxID=56646 RepID=A0A2L2TNM3_9HYPO|nr:uncharacterized protein FVRRES_06636 [Fusarium venenatum]KAG8351588.1 hypothetical protein FVEN_g10301 [Fusarium venenatum]KAH6993619.1 hypothetical protein EDB82DRAFT_524702 [Fusarium venenatum]CEI62200.1 unnamed protein product [Fusarium venenatum]
MRTSRSILTILRVQPYFVPKQFSTMPSNRQIERGIDENVSHATGTCKVLEGLQEAVPKGVEESLPDSIHLTGNDPGQSTNKSHVKGDVKESVVPQKLQEILPESVERAVPNAIHDTGDAPVMGDKE